MDSVAQTKVLGQRKNILAPGTTSVKRPTSGKASPVVDAAPPTTPTTTNEDEGGGLTFEDAHGVEVEEDEFNFTNPLYDVTASQPPTPPSSSSSNANSPREQPQRVLVSSPSSSALWVPLFNEDFFLRKWWRWATQPGPAGKIHIAVVALTPPSTIPLALRACINGESMRKELPSSSSGAKFDLFYYRPAQTSVDRLLNLQDAAELQLEVNESQTDAFVGAAALQGVDTAFTAKPKTVRLELPPSKHTLELSITYVPSTMRENLNLKLEGINESRRRAVRTAQNLMKSVPPFLMSMWEVGLRSTLEEGKDGGAAASLGLLAVCFVPFAVVTLLTNWSFAFRSYFLIVPLYAYVALSLPVLFGWLFGTLITVLPMASYPGKFKCGALHIQPWFKGWSLMLRICANEMKLGNPIDFPIPDFFACDRCDISGRISFRHLLDILLRRYKRCPLKKVPDFKLLAKFDFDYIEVDNFFLDFQLYQSKFNINELVHQIAHSRAQGLAWWNGYWKKGDKMPNELEIRVIRAKNLTKTKDLKPPSTMAQQTAAAAAAQARRRGRTTLNEGILGSNGVIDAFLDDEDESDLDEGEEEGDEGEGERGENETSSSSHARKSGEGEDRDETKRREAGDDDDQEDVGEGSEGREGVGESGDLSQGPGRAGERISMRELKRSYRGGGPPSFNPMDEHVREKANQGHFDPYVVVSLRRDKQKTATQSNTNNPMFNQTFFFHAEDASTVVHVAVYNREVGSDVMLGQWLMTLKYLLSDPTFCWHEKGLEVGKDRWVRGWFPLMNKKFRGIGKCGKLEMAMQWRYVPEDKLRRKVELPRQTALQQLQENTNESRLRMGDMARVKYWLNHEPFLYDIHRFSVFGFRMFIKDLFVVGTRGDAEKKDLDKLHYIDIPRVDWLREFRPRHGDFGITTYKVLFVFFRGIAPKVLDTASSRTNVGSTLSVIASTALSGNLSSAMKHLAKGQITKLGLVNSLASGVANATKSVDRAIQVMHRNITVNQQLEKDFKVPVDAADEDFLIEKPTVSGYLARYATKAPSKEANDVDMEAEVKRKGHFLKKYFELKGRTLFFRTNRNPKVKTIYGVSYKIRLEDVFGAIYFKEQEEIMLNMRTLQCFTRLRLVANEREGDEDEEGGSPSLQKWLEALKGARVDVFVWERR